MAVYTDSCDQHCSCLADVSLVLDKQQNPDSPCHRHPTRVSLDKSWACAPSGLSFPSRQGPAESELEKEEGETGEAEVGLWEAGRQVSCPEVMNYSQSHSLSPPGTPLRPTKLYATYELLCAHTLLQVQGNRSSQSMHIGRG